MYNLNKCWCCTSEAYTCILLAANRVDKYRVGGIYVYIYEYGTGQIYRIYIKWRHLYILIISDQYMLIFDISYNLYILSRSLIPLYIIFYIFIYFYFFIIFFYFYIHLFIYIHIYSYTYIHKIYTLFIWKVVMASSFRW